MASLLKTAVPYATASTTSIQEVIQSVAQEVVKQGVEYETVLRGSPDSKYAFLRDPSSQDYGYYSWVLFCMQRNIALDRLKAMEAEHALKLQACRPGFLDLTDKDQQHLMQLLEQNKGTKQQIGQLRTWIMDHAHSIYAIGLLMRKFCAETFTNSYMSPEERYNQVLFTIYVINDILSNSQHALFKGAYTSVLDEGMHVEISVVFFPHLPIIMKTCHMAAVNDGQRDKILKLAKLWEIKGFLDAQRSSILSMTLAQIHMPPEPPQEALVSPYIDFKIIASALKPVAIPGSQYSLNAYSTNIPLPPPPPPLMMPPPPAPTLSLPPQAAPFHQYSSASYPPAPLLAPTPMIDLMQIPVGNMANIAKAFNKAGAPAYAPLDLAGLTRAINPHVEPGRLEARIMDFIRKYDDIKSNKGALNSDQKKERRRRDHDSDDEYYSRDRERDRKSSRRY